jgi:hypothetical protein
MMNPETTVQYLKVRDYFAAHCPSQIIEGWTNFGDYEGAAKVAYKYADAMMKAREIKDDN